VVRINDCKLPLAAEFIFQVFQITEDYAGRPVLEIKVTNVAVVPDVTYAAVGLGCNPGNRNR
jgi:hypothetical protein